ncbi:MAG TPA: hypothetical protein VJT73_04655, partial [Polyangiaceae bacterium]|nr:hypothetical protein [Polyangiaceae bacterium]
PAGSLTVDDVRGLTLSAEPKGDARRGETGAESGAFELPLVLDQGQMSPAVKEARSMRRRGAVCVTPTGHTVIAMATSESDEAGVVALQRVGCTRAVALDRGSHRSSFLHRVGGGSPPLARYEESVLYAISRPIVARAYRLPPP